MNELAGDLPLESTMPMATPLFSSDIQNNSYSHNFKYADNNNNNNLNSTASSSSSSSSSSTDTSTALESSTQWLDLPIDVLCAIFVHLDDVEDLLRCEQVCKSWLIACRYSMNLHWRWLYLRTFGPCRPGGLPLDVSVPELTASQLSYIKNSLQHQLEHSQHYYSSESDSSTSTAPTNTSPHSTNSTTATATTTTTTTTITNQLNNRTSSIANTNATVESISTMGTYSRLLSDTLRWWAVSPLDRIFFPLSCGIRHSDVFEYEKPSPTVTAFIDLFSPKNIAALTSASPSSSSSSSSLSSSPPALERNTTILSILINSLSQAMQTNQNNNNNNNINNNNNNNNNEEVAQQQTNNPPNTTTNPAGVNTIVEDTVIAVLAPADNNQNNNNNNNNQNNNNQNNNNPNNAIPQRNPFAFDIYSFARLPSSTQVKSMKSTVRSEKQRRRELTPKNKSILIEHNKLNMHQMEIHGSNFVESRLLERQFSKKKYAKLLSTSSTSSHSSSHSSSNSFNSSSNSFNSATSPSSTSFSFSSSSSPSFSTVGSSTSPSHHYHHHIHHHSLSSSVSPSQVIAEIAFQENRLLENSSAAALNTTTDFVTPITAAEAAATRALSSSSSSSSSSSAASTTTTGSQMSSISIPSTGNNNHNSSTTTTTTSTLTPSTASSSTSSSTSSAPVNLPPPLEVRTDFPEIHFENTDFNLEISPAAAVADEESPTSNHINHDHNNTNSNSSSLTQNNSSSSNLLTSVDSHKSSIFSFNETTLNTFINNKINILKNNNINNTSNSNNNNNNNNNNSNGNNSNDNDTLDSSQLLVGSRGLSSSQASILSTLGNNISDACLLHGKVPWRQLFENRWIVDMWVDSLDFDVSKLGEDGWEWTPTENETTIETLILPTGFSTQTPSIEQVKAVLISALSPLPTDTTPDSLISVELLDNWRPRTVLHTLVEVWRKSCFNHGLSDPMVVGSHEVGYNGAGQMGQTGQNNVQQNNSNLQGTQNTDSSSSSSSSFSFSSSLSTTTLSSSPPASPNPTTSSSSFTSPSTFTSSSSNSTSSSSSSSTSSTLPRRSSKGKDAAKSIPSSLTLSLQSADAFKLDLLMSLARCNSYTQQFTLTGVRKWIQRELYSIESSIASIRPYLSQLYSICIRSHSCPHTHASEHCRYGYVLPSGGVGGGSTNNNNNNNSNHSSSSSSSSSSFPNEMDSLKVACCYKFFCSVTRDFTLVGFGFLDIYSEKRNSVFQLRTMSD